MAKRISKEEKKEKLIIDLINEMFKIAGHAVTYDDVVGRKDDWYNQWTMTDADYDQWKKWGTLHISKTLNIPKYQAEREMAMVGLNWGLKFQK